MKIVTGFPPNYEDIKKAFPVDSADVIFAYGDTIFNPNGRKIADHNIYHEQVHERQQKDDPVSWWKQYIENPTFRIRQEVEAYGAQHRYISKYYGHIEARQALTSFATFLSGPVYGTGLSFSEAKRKIHWASQKHFLLGTVKV